MNRFRKIPLTFLLHVAQTCCLLLLSASLLAQGEKTNNATAPHPRLNVADTSRVTLQNTIRNEEWARSSFEQAKQGIDAYVNRHQSDSTWIVSRLQMFWKTRATDVYIKGGVYDHAEGLAPVPTVRFPGTRDNVTAYSAPKLEDIVPYMDDPRGVYLVNKSKQGQPLEWVEISKTARVLESINTQIMSMANTAAFVYWLTGEEKYARFAFDLFDTYMTGMYYRKLPVDLTHGHHQTITGLSTFEVIQEVAMLNSLTGIYDYLYPYLQARAPQKMTVYTETFKKWADVQIGNGVAFNNWNLMQAKNVLNIAMILEENGRYADGKGQQYYADAVLNKDFERQWSLTKIVNEGYDPVAGLWNESPGYSLGVLGDFTGFVSFFDKHFNKDILPQMPVLSKAAVAIAQYLFPNGYISSFGDSHYRRLSTAAAEELLVNARRNKKEKLEDSLTRFVRTINRFNQQTGDSSGKAADAHGTPVRGIAGLLSRQNAATLKESVTGGNFGDYATPVFYSSKVSYLALRNGLHPRNGLMAVLSGSKGNHMHAGGISMEIFGKGLVLGPESGIGTSYFQQDYAEYYSQFPAHNTVAVDGISAYPVMKSNHGFDLKSSYPASAQATGFFPGATFGEAVFLEPETQADQNRLLSLIRTTDSTGYYVDIFRSRKRDGKDKLHDYFYHNLGQQLTLTDNAGRPLALQPTQKLSFSGGHLFAYDYFWDKQAATAAADVNATFALRLPGREDLFMNVWMKGAPGREIFSVKAPPSKAFGNNAMIPDSIAALPMPTIVARQTGEAWKRPFVVVYEPSTTSQPKSVRTIRSFTALNTSQEFVGLVIESANGRRDFVFSTTAAQEVAVYGDKQLAGTYGVISEDPDGLRSLFLGNGRQVRKEAFQLSVSGADASAALSREADGWYVTATAPVVVTLPATVLGPKSTIGLEVDGKLRAFRGKRTVEKGQAVWSFSLPAVPFTRIQF